MDVVADVLELSGVRGTIGARTEAGGDWSVPVAGSAMAVVHVVTAGSAWLGLQGSSPRWRKLVAGDAVLMLDGPAHVLSSGPGTSASVVDAKLVSRAFGSGEPILVGSQPADTRIVTIGYECDHTVHTQILGTLREMVHIRGGDGEDGFDDTVRMLGRELSHPQLAGRAVLNSLVDVLLVQLVRAWLPTQSGHHGTWLGVLADPLVHSAMERLHAEPASPWTTARLAVALDVSRATLTRRFVAAIGQSPAAYLTQWRLDLAAVRLRGTLDPVETVAAAVGYQSVPAFSRAFARSRGMPPGRYRNSAHDNGRLSA